MENAPSTDGQVERLVSQQHKCELDYVFIHLDVKETTHAIYYDLLFKRKTDGKTYKAHSSCFKFDLTEVAAG